MPQLARVGGGGRDGGRLVGDSSMQYFQWSQGAREGSGRWKTRRTTLSAIHERTRVAVTAAAPVLSRRLPDRQRWADADGQCERIWTSTTRSTGTVRRVLNIGGTGGDLRRMPPSLNPLDAALHRAVVRPALASGRRRWRRRSHWTMADYADDAAALLAAIGWDRAGVVGTSFGGMVALNLAVRHPDLVDRLVLCCTSPGGAYPSYPLHELAPAECGRRDAFAAAHAAHRPPMGSRRRRADPRPRRVLRADGRRRRDDRSTPEAATGLRRQLLARAGHDVVDVTRFDRRADARVRRPLRRPRSARQQRTPRRSGSRAPASRCSTAATCS